MEKLYDIIKRGEYCIFILNDLDDYNYIYNLLEKVDEHFIKYNYNILKNILNYLNDGTSVYIYVNDECQYGRLTVDKFDKSFLTNNEPYIISDMKDYNRLDKLDEIFGK